MRPHDGTLEPWELKVGTSLLSELARLGDLSGWTSHTWTRLAPTLRSNHVCKEAADEVHHHLLPHFTESRGNAHDPHGGARSRGGRGEDVGGLGFWRHRDRRS
jgi:hypothetical protein